MTTENSASIDRYSKAMAELRRQQFFRHPETQAEAIATHYAQHAVMALHVLEIIREMKHSRLYCQPQPDINLFDAVEHCIGILKRNHEAAFGIKLEWNAEIFG